MEAAALPDLEALFEAASPASAGPPRGAALPRLELRCSWCGYGVVVSIAPDSCPMCQGSGWERAGRPHRPDPQLV